MRIALILLFFFSFNNVNSQTITGFSSDKVKFLKEYEIYLTASKREDVKKVSEEFQANFKNGKLSDVSAQHVISTANTMAIRQMAAIPYFLEYTEAINTLIRSNFTEAQIVEYTKTLAELTKNQKKGSNSEFSKFMQFTFSFYGNGFLEQAQGRNYKTDTKTFSISFENGMPVYNFTNTKLHGIADGDSIVILETGGSYAPLSKIWKGKSGKVNWLKCGLDPSIVNASFGSYTINMQNNSYSVDSVVFVHKEFFDKPLIGKLTDKIVPHIDSNRLSYPRFESSNFNIAIKNFAPNVTFNGGFSLWGDKVIGYGSPENKARLDFYTKDNKTKIVSVIAQNITFKKGEELGATDAFASLYFDKDSIFHPKLNVFYKIKERQIKMVRGNTGQGKAQFFDSFHNFAFEADAIFWNIDSSTLNLRTLSGIGKAPAIFESKDYFSKDAMRKVQGNAAYEPLFILQKLVKDNNDLPNLDATKVAKALNPSLTEGESRSLFYELVEKGFIEYDEALSLVIVKEKTGMYVRANAKKIDYDNIRIKSTPKSGIEDIVVTKNTIELKGVSKVPISDTANVNFFPKNNNLILEKDRNMKFDGLIWAGRMDIFGKENHFNYAPFTVDLPTVDSMRINIPDGDKLDAEGNPQLVTLLSKLENMKGFLEVDAPINKSGRVRLLQFPKLVNRENSFVYYDDKAIANGAYNRKNFYFQVNPFKLDSLNTFTPSVINWKGKLVSNIFPEFEENLKIQDDLSLGFKTSAPTTGWDLYKDKGSFKGDINLNYKGVTGGGDIKHSTASFDSDTIKFYPDSLDAIAKDFSIAKTADGVKTPAVKSKGNPIHWLSKSDSMVIKMKEDPFDMFEGQTSLKGDLVLSKKGLTGKGSMDWAEANLTSKSFAFETEKMSGDSAKLNIKSSEEGKIAFKQDNVQAKVDFKERIGDFKSNTPDVPTTFDYNKYQTTINEFKWYMDKRVMEFIAPPSAINGSPFTSLKPDQKGLTFNGKKGIYNLETSLLTVQGIKDIRVADASVIPDSGVVYIEGEAKMRDLSNATIIADTLNKTHKIDNASVSIISKERMIASGNYMYITEGLPDQKIRFNDISCINEVKGEKKETVTEWHLSAKGDIDEAFNFLIYQNVNFKGKANLYSQRPGLIFDGFAKIDFKKSTINFDNFNINQEVNPKKLNLGFNENTKNSDGVKLFSGLFINKLEYNYIYPCLVGPKTDNSDWAFLPLAGSVMHDSKTNYWMFGDVKKGYEGSLSGNIIRYDDKTSLLLGEGKFNLGNFGAIPNLTSGNIIGKTDSSNYKMNVTMAFDFTTNKDINERFMFHLYNDNLDNNDVNYDREAFRKQLADLAGDQEKIVSDDFEKTGIFKRTKPLTHFLVLSDVNLVWDNVDGKLRSVGRFGLSFVGDKPIHKRVDGYIEVNYRPTGDFINIYIKTGTNEWIFLEYRPGYLGIFTSPEYEDVTKLITALPSEKRTVKFQDGRSINFGLGSSINKEDFVQRMKEKAQNAGLKEEAPKPKPKKVIDSTSTKLDSTTVIDPRKLPKDESETVKPAPVKSDRQKLEEERFKGDFKLFDGPPQPSAPNKIGNSDSSLTIPEQQKKPEENKDDLNSFLKEEGKASGTSDSTKLKLPSQENDQAVPVNTEPEKSKSEPPLTPPTEQEKPKTESPVEPPVAEPEKPKSDTPVTPQNETEKSKADSPVQPESKPKVSEQSKESSGESSGSESKEKKKKKNKSNENSDEIPE